jgi:hypothetical protein
MLKHSQRKGGADFPIRTQGVSAKVEALTGLGTCTRSAHALSATLTVGEGEIQEQGAAHRSFAARFSCLKKESPKSAQILVVGPLPRKARENHPCLPWRQDEVLPRVLTSNVRQARNEIYDDGAIIGTPHVRKIRVPLAKQIAALAQDRLVSPLTCWTSA